MPGLGFLPVLTLFIMYGLKLCTEVRTQRTVPVIRVLIFIFGKLYGITCPMSSMQSQ